MKRQIAAILALTLTSAAPISAHAASPVVIGPGPHPQLYVTANEDYQVLDGTEITSLSESGPPDDFVVPDDAIEFRGGGHIRIDGGSFRGGNATYSATDGSSAITVGGDALHLRQSTGEVHGGTFNGGNALSTNYLGPVIGGHGLILVESDITIYSGYFEGGTTTSPGIFGGLRVVKEASIIASDSNVVMHGGQVVGNINIRDSVLSIFGRQLVKFVSAARRTITPVPSTVHKTSCYGQ